MSAVLDRTLIPLPWRAALLRLAVLWLAIFVLYGDALRSMVLIWSRSDTFAHGFLVAPISAWLVWRQRERLRAAVPGLMPWMALPMAAVAAGWLLGEAAGANVLTQFCATALLVLAVPATLGRQAARVLAFPLLFLFFMVPMGEFMTQPMMEWTADFTVYAVAKSGVPVYREGQNFIIPSGSWSVVEACSGVRYLIASFMVGTLFAYLNFHTLRRRLLFCGVALLIPIVANWVRAYLIVMIGHTSGNQLAVGADHLVYGWVFFGVVILLMFMAGARWAEAPLKAQPAAPSPSAGPARAAPGLGLALALALLVALAPVYARQVLASGAAGPVTLSLPTLAGTTVVPEDPAGPLLQPIFEGAAAQAWRLYRTGDGDVLVHVAYYRQQGYGRKLVSSENMLVRSRDPRWNRMASGHQPVAVGGADLEFQTAELLGPDISGAAQRPRLDVRQIYWAGGHWTHSDQAALLRVALARLRGQGDDGAVLTLAAPGSDAAATRARLDRFTQQHLNTIESHLTAVRASR
jgi:exosortase A